MKAVTSLAALALALLLAGCSGGESANAGGNSADSATGGATVAAIPAPNGGDWSQVVSQTPAGGFVMGNPDAPVKIIEFASMTCPHCATFSEEGMPALTENYIKSGQVSLELRNFVLNPVDLGASLLARCGGPGPFFKLTDQMFAAQSDWGAKAQAAAQAQQQQLAGLQPQQLVTRLTEGAGLVDFVRLRGVPTEKARQCLASKAELDRLVGMTEATTKQFPQFPGTPSFVINGELAENTSNWAALEPKLQAALR